MAAWREDIAALANPERDPVQPQPGKLATARTLIKDQADKLRG